MEFPGIEPLREQASQAAGGLTDFGDGFEAGLAQPIRAPFVSRHVRDSRGEGGRGR